MSLLDAFKKKDDSDVPDVTEMVKNGMSEQDIIDNLRQQGYDSTSIKTALVNATLAAGSPQNMPPPAPRQPQMSMPQSFSMPPQQTFSPPPQPAPQAQMPKPDVQKSGLSDQALDTIQQVLEQIIEEKWQSASADLSSIKTSVKANKANSDNLDDKISKLNQRLDSIQNVMLGKTEDYNKTLSDVNVELQAFEKVIDRLIPTISDSIKELRDLIDDLKSTKS